MKEYSSIEIQDISSEFRSVARRLSRTDHAQCSANLKRFMSVLQEKELIAEFISSKNIISYDISAILKARDWLDPFEISPILEEEISFCMQLLQYAIDHYEGDFTRLYGTFYYTSSKSSVNDEMRKFIEHIVDPLIDHISEYLHRCYELAERREKADKPATTPSFSATNSTVVIGSRVDGNVSNQVSITEKEKTEANELITAVRSALAAEDIPNKDDIEELLQQMKKEINEGKKPQKGFLTALKVLCQAGTTIIPLITALIRLFS